MSALIHMPPKAPKWEDYATSSLGLGVAVDATIEWMDENSYSLAVAAYDIKLLRALVAMYDHHHPGTPEYEELQQAEKSMRAIIDRTPLGRCRQLEGESAGEARARSIRECAKDDAYWPIVLDEKDGRGWYDKVYLQSEHWANLRSLTLAMHPKDFCHKCHQTRKDIQVHHLIYRDIFDVTTDDLQPLCWPCHQREHRAAL